MQPPLSVTPKIAVIREQLKVYTVYSGAEIEQGYRRCGYHCQCLDAWRNFTNLDFTCSHVKQVEEILDSKEREPEHFVHTSGSNYRTPEEVVAFLNEPPEESDEGPWNTSMFRTYSPILRPRNYAASTCTCNNLSRQ